jgi:glycine/D-amino acid oxidase-like deaminating enzyme
VVGASVAYWLTRMRPGIEVAIIERDRSFSRASSALSASSIRRQFSSPINVRMSQFGAQFLQELGIALHERGYLYLGRAHELPEVAVLGRQELAARFPWLNVADVDVASLGLSGEGWFDGPALHAELLRRARSQGARLIDGEVKGFDLRGKSIVAARFADGSLLPCKHAVNAAGPWAREVAAAAGIELPVHARRRTVFVLSCPAPLPGCPLVIDPSGFWFRPEGKLFIAGREPSRDADNLPLEPDYAEFDEDWWARMAHRVPAFEALRVERAWAGYYEMNLFDHNAIIGAHPTLANLWFANGFSGHGMQHAAAAGRGVAELVLHGNFSTLDLSPLGFRRLIDKRPLLEANVIG